MKLFKSSKKPMKIKIIADSPENGQDSIANLIGKIFDVKNVLKNEDGSKPSVQISAIEWDGVDSLIIIQPNEYVLVDN